MSDEVRAAGPLERLVSSLAPCPFCGAGESRIDESTHWTGMRSVVISARVMHWCQRQEGQPQSTIQIAGKTAEQAAENWNKRANTGVKGRHPDAPDETGNAPASP